MSDKNWIENFDDRQKKEIEFAILYARDFHHGTNGHNGLMIIAKMAEILDTEWMENKVYSDMKITDEKYKQWLKERGLK